MAIGLLLLMTGLVLVSIYFYEGLLFSLSGLGSGGLVE